MENDITRHAGDNLGGVNSFKFLATEGVEEMPEPLSGIIHQEVAVKAGYRWLEGYCTEETMDYSEEQIDGEHGAFFRRILTGSVPKDRPEISYLMQQMKDRPFILDITYNNGTRKLAGTKEEPMYFKSKLTSKKQVSGRNEHEISFSGEGTSNAPFYLY